MSALPSTPEALPGTSSTVTFARPMGEGGPSSSMEGWIYPFLGPTTPSHSPVELIHQSNLVSLGKRVGLPAESW